MRPVAFSHANTLLVKYVCACFQIIVVLVKLSTVPPCTILNWIDVMVCPCDVSICFHKFRTLSRTISMTLETLCINENNDENNLLCWQSVLQQCVLAKLCACHNAQWILWPVQRVRGATLRVCALYALHVGLLHESCARTCVYVVYLFSACLCVCVCVNLFRYLTFYSYATEITKRAGS